MAEKRVGKVVLAYSGGLDTSIILKWLQTTYGCEVVATDLDPDDTRSKDWQDTDQHASGRVEALNSRGICPSDRFFRQVRYRNVDMNFIPEDLRDFDFVWSSCALEHIGSLRHGLDFILHAMDCLKPGGWAIHTTEFNLTSNPRGSPFSGSSTSKR